MISRSKFELKVVESEKNVRRKIEKKKIFDEKKEKEVENCPFLEDKIERCLETDEKTWKFYLIPRKIHWNLGKSRKLRKSRKLWIIKISDYQKDLGKLKFSGWSRQFMKNMKKENLGKFQKEVQENLGKLQIKIHENFLE